jgi:hypothetical protein
MAYMETLSEARYLVHKNDSRLKLNLKAGAHFPFSCHRLGATSRNLASPKHSFPLLGGSCHIPFPTSREQRRSESQATHRNSQRAVIRTTRSSLIRTTNDGLEFFVGAIYGRMYMFHIP